MPYEIGGRADKYGNSYEIRWIVFQLLNVVEEKLDYILMEALGEDESGVDLWVGNHNSSVEGQQCKGRNGSKESWDYGSINAKGIPNYWKSQLDRDTNTTVSLVSPLAFTFLEDLISRAKTCGGDSNAFYNIQIKQASKEFQNFFRYLCRAMSINVEYQRDLDRCVSYLERITYRQISDFELSERIMEKIRHLFLGDEEVIRDAFITWVVDGSMIGKKINQIEITSFLNTKGFITRNLINDERIIPNIQKLNNEYRDEFDAIGNKLILRSEFKTCKDAIRDEKSIIIHGKAGRGKSGCTLEITNFCESTGIPYIALKLDQHIPHGTTDIWSEELGFSTSISYCIDSISRDSSAVIILDQLDSLRWTQSQASDSLIVCQRIIKEIAQLNLEREHKISLVFVCRTYDLENDNTIRHLFDKEESSNWERLKIGDLNEIDVKNIIGSSYNGLTHKLKELLKIPGNLYIWKQLDPNRIDTEYTSTSQLVAAWWKQLSNKCYQSGLDTNDLDSQKKLVVEWLQIHGRIFFPVSNINQKYLEFLSSNSFFKIQGNKVSFAHQSILDCFFADNLFDKYFEDEPIEKIIGNKNQQTPGKRYQIQIFMEKLLEYDTEEFLKFGQEIFKSPEIRFSIKFIFFELLNQLETIDSNVEQFIIDNYDDEYYGKYLINNVISGKKEYISLLQKNGILEEMIKLPQTKDIVCELLRSITPAYTNEMVSFIQKQFLTDDLRGDIIKLLDFFPYDFNRDSEALFRIRLKLYDRFPDKANSYINFRTIEPGKEIRVIQAIIYIIKSKSNNQNMYSYPIESIDHIKEFIKNNSIEILDLLIPLIPVENDDINDWSEEHNYNNRIERFSIQIIKESNKQLIIQNPQAFWQYYEKFMGKGSYLFNELIMDGLYQLPKTFSDRIIRYITKNIETNIIVFTDGSVSKLSLAKKVLKKHANHCNDEIFKELETTINTFMPGSAKTMYKRRVTNNSDNPKKVYWRFYGDLQIELLPDLPQARCSRDVLDNLKVLNRKFLESESKYQNRNIEAGNVQSPIAGKELSIVQWLKILSNKKIRDNNHSTWNQKNNVFIEHGIQYFSDSFRENVSKNPGLFIRLVLNNKNLVLEEYIDSLFQGISNSDELSEVPVSILEQLILTFPYDYSVSRTQAICRIIEKRCSDKWSECVLIKLKDIVVNYHDLGNIENDDSYNSLESRSLNGVRGIAMYTIGKLVDHNNSLLDFFRNTISVSVSDKDSAVRLATLYTVYSIYFIDKTWATPLLLELYKQDFRLAGFSGSQLIFSELYSNYRTQILEIILKSYISADERLIKAGTHYLTEMYIINNEFQEIFIQIDKMSELQATEVFNMAIHYINVEEYSDVAKEIILDLRNNRNNYSIPISNIFYNNRIDLKRDKDFLINIMSSSVSYRSIYAFVNYIEKESEKIIDYKDIILPLSRNLLESDLDRTSSWRVDESISKLIIGLYDGASGVQDETLANLCLDIWDVMFERQFGSARQLSQDIMDR
ncbi:hypothetical protein [Latilactobacillus sakei]|uniref:Uncharacterized protein n=1 Tax=Latilactobacillus sakei TaxID=1599 RepID=A0AAF0GL99_LATSK|nr:hypothetical protein [Latilactobacillus sakei]WGI18179.1 hypothetical protein QBD03_05295 [Latilactobacillus sakei]